MSTGVRVALQHGREAAEGVMSWLQPAVHRIEIAGSIRRDRADVGDIELVAVPVIETEPDGLFGQRQRNSLTESIDKMLSAGLLRSHPTDSKRGERYSKLIHPASGLQIDLFSASAESFGLIYLIRTGPVEYSHNFVIDLRKRALHVAGGQLHRGGMGCGSYVCEVVPTPNEEDVYAAAGWPFVQPRLRA